LRRGVGGGEEGGGGKVNSNHIKILAFKLMIIIIL
jgi:hypothetical protein